MTLKELENYNLKNVASFDMNIYSIDNIQIDYNYAMDNLLEEDIYTFSPASNISIDVTLEKKYKDLIKEI